MSHRKSGRPSKGMVMSKHNIELAIKSTQSCAPAATTLRTSEPPRTPDGSAPSRNQAPRSPAFATTCSSSNTSILSSSPWILSKIWTGRVCWSRGVLFSGLFFRCPMICMPTIFRLASSSQFIILPNMFNACQTKRRKTWQER